MHDVYLVARREFLTRARSRFFLIGTVIFMVLLGGFIVLQSELLNRPSTVNVGFTGDAQVLAAPLKQAVAADPSLKVETHNVDSVAAGQSQIRNGDLDVLVAGDPGKPDVYVKDQIDTTVQAELTSLVKLVALNRALAAAGADPAKIQAEVAAANINLNFLDPNAAEQAQHIIVGIFVAALLYVALILYGQFVAQGVVEEKQNRIIEILLATVRPSQLLFGKVLGIGLLGLVQLLLLGAVGLIVSSRTNAINVPEVGLEAVLGGIVWFVLGFIFYALVYAAAGSLVSRQEDLAGVLGPLSMLVVGTYLAFFWMVGNPDNPIGIVLAMIPPFSPILMPARMAAGQIEAWQVAVALLLAVGAIVGMTALASRIYSNSVLRMGSRINLFEAWRGV